MGVHRRNFTAEQRAAKIAVYMLVSRLACVPTAQEVAEEGFVFDRVELDTLTIAARLIEGGDSIRAVALLNETDDSKVHCAP